MLILFYYRIGSIKTKKNWKIDKSAVVNPNPREINENACMIYI
jgi:hypothetical protein